MRIILSHHKIIQLIEWYWTNLPKGGFQFISGGKNLPGLKSVLKKLFHFHKKLFFFATAYFHFHAITHHHSAPFAPHIFLYMHEIYKKRFMYAKKNRISQ